MYNYQEVSDTSTLRILDQLLDVASYIKNTFTGQSTTLSMYKRQCCRQQLVAVTYNKLKPYGNQPTPPSSRCRRHVSTLKA